MFFCEVVLLRWCHSFFYMVVSYSWRTFSGKINSNNNNNSNYNSNNTMSFVVISFKSCTLTRKRKPKGPAQEPRVTGFRNSLNTKAPKRWWLTLFSVLRPTWRLTHNRLIFSPASSVHLTTHQYKHLGCRRKETKWGGKSRSSLSGSSGLLWIKANMT